MGIRKKIRLGFVSLASLLFLSGIISIFELSKLNKSTQSILDTSVRNIELSKQLLDEVQTQNIALLQIVAFSKLETDTSLYRARDRFSETLNHIWQLNKNSPQLDSIQQASIRYNEIVNRVIFQSSDTADIHWFMDVYQTSYLSVTTSVKNFMVETQNLMERNTLRLESNAYRAIMPGIIALGAAMLLVVIFCFFMDLYYIKPLVKMKQSLQNYISSKIPYNVKFEGGDELARLNEYIRELIMELRKRKSE